MEMNRQIFSSIFNTLLISNIQGLKFISVTWSFLIISIVIFFGSIIGLGMALKKVSRLNFGLITILYVVSIAMILSVLTQIISMVYEPINQYIAEIIGILGLFILLAGIITIKNWKCNKQITYRNNHAFIVSIFGNIIGAVSVYALLIGPNPEKPVEITVLICLGFLITIFVAFSFSKFLKKLEKPYPIIVSNFMILVGFYFMMFAAFIPNIATLANVHMDPLYLRSSNYVVFLVIALMGIFLCGVFTQNIRTQRKTML